MSKVEKTTSWEVEYEGANFTDVEGGPSTWAAGIGSAVMLAFFVQGVVGTSWILVALSRVAELRRSVVNVFVISLCINDLCTLFFVALVIIDSYVWRRWRAGDVMCRLNPELTVAFTGCTLWHTALIAIHRYLVVVHGNAYHRISKRAYIDDLIVSRCFFVVTCAAMLRLKPVYCVKTVLRQFPRCLGLGLAGSVY